jgi:hypothetical protein
MIVVAAITKIKIPIANAIFDGSPQVQLDSTDSATSLCQTCHIFGKNETDRPRTAAERNPMLPNVPTSKEAGLPEFQASAWNALPRG